jgi:carbamoyl-phosphate synthase large subunit
VNATRRILLPGAGTGTGNNLIRSLRADYSGVVVVGVNVDRFTLRNSKANRNYLLPPPAHPRFVDGLRRLIEREKIDLLIPITDADVSLTSELRDTLPCRVFLPSKSVIEQCQDKYELSRLLAAHGVPVAATHRVTDLDSLSPACPQAAPGAGSAAATRRGGRRP